MTSRDFVYWLQGYLEIASADKATGVTLTSDQLVCVQQHLALVFTHEIDPSMGNAAHQQTLNEQHSANPSKPTIGGVGPGGMIYRC